jgi:hypothetical protein
MGMSRLPRRPPVSQFQTTCEECGEEIVFSRSRRTSRRLFCSDKRRYRDRDRRRYEADPEGQREKSRRYYALNREKVLAKAAARRATVPRAQAGSCSECAEEMTGRANRVVCSKRCADRRYRRLHPEGIGRSYGGSISAGRPAPASKSLRLVRSTVPLSGDCELAMGADGLDDRPGRLGTQRRRVASSFLRQEHSGQSMGC